ncbi:MAG: beta-lactamase family protein [Bacteroidales bacterium]|nr:beta-lactamase family protein [Bacteroidales bacterium]
MKIKIFIKAILLVVLFFWGIEFSFSDKDSTETIYAANHKAISHRLNNNLSTFKETLVIDDIVTRFMKENGLIGATVAIAKDGRLVYTKGFGYSDKENLEMVEPKHVFRIASVSKLVTGIAIMKLVEEGKLSLEDKVFGPEGILSDSVYTDVLDKRIYEIKVKHLLYHTGGWSRNMGDPMFAPVAIAHYMKEDLPIGPETIIKYTLQRKKLAYKPGTRYSYSNLGYAILGEVVEEKTGMNYEDYVKQEILEPVGIYDIHIGTNFYEDKAPNEVRYYEPAGSRKCLACDGSGRYVAKAYGGNNIQALGAAGGWVASSSELLKLVLSVDGFDSKPDILREGIIDTMTTRDPVSRSVIGWKGSDGYGTWWRTGTLSGTTALVMRHKNGISWVFITNTSSKSHRIHNAISRMMFQAVNSVKEWPDHDLYLYYQPEKINPIELLSVNP